MGVCWQQGFVDFQRCRVGFAYWFHSEYTDLKDGSHLVNHENKEMQLANGGDDEKSQEKHVDIERGASSFKNGMFLHFEWIKGNEEGQSDTVKEKELCPGVEVLLGHMSHLDGDCVVCINTGVDSAWYQGMLQKHFTLGESCSKIYHVEHEVEADNLLDHSHVIHGFTMRSLLLSEVGPLRELYRLIQAILSILKRKCSYLLATARNCEMRIT